MAQANYIPTERAPLQGAASSEIGMQRASHPHSNGHGDAGQSGDSAPHNTGDQPQSGNREAVNSNDKLSSVFIIEPEALLRQMLKTAIEATGQYAVVGTAQDFSEAEKVLETQPEILVTELFISGKPLAGLLDQLRPVMSRTKILVLSRASDQSISRQIQSVPAHGFVSKQDQPERFFEVLDQLRQNNGTPIDQPTDKPGFEANYNDPIACLSPREREIFQLLADGFQNTVIAKKLFISPRTVETHRARVVRKLGLTSNGDLIRFAIKHGLSSL